MIPSAAVLKADTQRLGGPEKAALVLLTLPRPQAMELIRQLDPEEIKVLTKAAEKLRIADDAEIDRTIAEFEASFTSVIRSIGNGGDVRGLIAEVLGQEQFDAVIAGPRSTEEPIWLQIADMKDQALNEYLTRQHPQAIAYILTQLPSSRVAGILTLLGSEQRNDLIGRMLTLGTIPERVKAEVERALREDLRKTSAAPSRPHGSIAGILNELDAPLTEEAIAYLEGAVPEDAGIIRKLLFKFEDLPTLSAKSLTTLFDRIPVERIVIALQGLDPALQNTILSALAPRARRLAESELTSGATAPAGEVTAARRAIVDMVLPLLASGELTLADAEAVAPIQA